MKEIESQITEVINGHKGVQTEITRLLEKCEKKVEQGGLSVTAGSRTMLSSSCPPPPAQARKWQPVKELKAEKLVEGATTTTFTIWKYMMYDYLELPDESAGHYPTTKEVIPYINANLDGWWYGRMEGKLSDSISVKENFDKIQLEVSALDPVINCRDRLVSM